MKNENSKNFLMYKIFLGPGPDPDPMNPTFADPDPDPMNPTFADPDPVGSGSGPGSGSTRRALLRSLQKCHYVSREASRIEYYLPSCVSSGHLTKPRL
jgi:hypothetical protein